MRIFHNAWQLPAKITIWIADLKKEDITQWHVVHKYFKVITFATDIILVVRVPVLSLQITVVQPSVSTDGKDRTIAFNRAIRFVPRAKHLHLCHQQLCLFCYIYLS